MQKTHIPAQTNEAMYTMTKSAPQPTNNSPDTNKGDTFSVALTSDDIELLLDCINAQMTEAKWKKNPDRGEAVYELYQTVGQALGETEIKLQFRVTDLVERSTDES